jgi:hypothetical protein
MDKSIQFFTAAMPNPTDEDRCRQMGVHFEEEGEMFEALGMKDAAALLSHIAKEFKTCTKYAMGIMKGADMVALADSVFDQAVTGKSIAYTHGWNYDGGLSEVEDSNLSKLEDGKAVFDENGKIAKGKYYRKPNLLPHL